MSAMLQLNSSNLAQAIAKLKTTIIEQDPKKLAAALQSFVLEGSQVHKISKEDLTVFIFKKDHEAFENETTTIAEAMPVILQAGTCYFDALFYLGLDKEHRPDIKVIDDPEEGTVVDEKGAKGDLTKITSFVFFVYFYIMVRGHAPTSSAAYKGQDVPQFLKAVLTISESPSVVAKYLASFDLNKINPAWVSEIPTTTMGREAQMRFGLGVAGYRVCSVFNYYTPDLAGWEKYSSAVNVAKSFLGAGLDWAFHPATRDASLLTKYGNINKNCTNLITLVYKADTIEKMLSTKKLAVKPVFDAGHTNYQTWTEVYVAKRLMFK